MDVPAGSTVEGQQSSCRYCGSTLSPGAKFCNACKKFQSRWHAFVDTISLSTFVTTLPLLAIVFAFMQDRIVFPYSEVIGVPVSCQYDTVTLGLSNVGNRPAIVKGGRLLVEPVTGDRIERDLVVPADRSMVLEPRKTDVRTFNITTLKGSEVGPLPPIEPGKKCSYRITLATSEFADDARQPRVISCECPEGIPQ